MRPLRKFRLKLDESIAEKGNPIYDEIYILWEIDPDGYSYWMLIDGELEIHISSNLEELKLKTI